MGIKKKGRTVKELLTDDKEQACQNYQLLQVS